MLWVIERTRDEKFPYRLRIQQGEEIILCLLVQEKWPGSKGHIFCKRFEEQIDNSIGSSDEVERVPVISLRRYGKRLAVVLDRSRNKRSDFLFLKKKYKTKEGEYEKLFWRTQKALMERRPRVKLTARGEAAIQVAIAFNERYSWKFTGCVVTRENLPVGDYALKSENGIIAVVERKSMQNLLHDFGDVAALQQTLGELETYEHSAMVVEAAYADFLKPKLTKPYFPSFTTKAIAELFALHPRLQIIFTDNRKLANEWALRFLSAIQSHERDHPHPPPHYQGSDRHPQGPLSLLWWKLL